MKILVTNDDSHRSPLIALLITYLKARHEVVVVVPKHEQSWRSKCMTRYGYLHKEDIEIAGYPAFSVDGTPADCVNVGIHHLCGDKKPDLIISGINAGLNIGTGFIFSSGTVGACLEANITGLPAIAFSQEFDEDTRNKYAAEYAMEEGVLSRLAEQSSLALDTVLDLLIGKRLVFEKPITWNVNFPFKLSGGVKPVLCRVAHSRYGSCFRKLSLSSDAHSDVQVPERFDHDLIDVTPNAVEGTDARLLRKGHVTLTPLDIDAFGQLDRASMERINQVIESL